MPTSAETTCRLLDLVSETADVEVADRALRHARAIASVSATRLRAQAHPLAFAAHLPAGGARLACALVEFAPEHEDTIAATWRGMSPIQPRPDIGPGTLRFVARIAALGRPRRGGGTLLPGARDLGLELLGRSGEDLTAIARALGRTEIAWVCRQLDRRTAIRLLHQLGPERETLARHAQGAPPDDPASFRAACGRLARLDFGAAHGGAIAGLVGRARLVGLLEGGDPAIAAAVGARFAPAPLDAAAPDREWLDCALRLVRALRDGVRP